MNINDLIAIIKKKLQDNLFIENIKIEDKSFLHKNHKGNQAERFHIKITIISGISYRIKSGNKVHLNF